METLILAAKNHYLISTYIVAINVLALMFYGSDKLSAASGAWRIRERTLLLVALCGGSMGALIGMKIFRHKTRKSSFQALFVLVLLLQLTGAMLLWRYTQMPIQTNFGMFVTEN